MGPFSFEKGTIKGLKESVLGAKKFKTPQSNCGCKIGPPAERECPEDPVAVANIKASA